VLLLSDWSPVDVLLSMVTLERPRRSMLGLTVELDPLMDEFTSEDEPVTDEVLPAVDPLIDGDDVALPLTDGEVEALPLPPVDPLSEPLLVPDEESEPVLLLLLPLNELPLAWLSGMQSWWTGLAECSLAWPVLLSASLPAFG
jgi:hypothetical protein